MGDKAVATEMAVMAVELSSVGAARLAQIKKQAQIGGARDTKECGVQVSQP